MFLRCITQDMATILNSNVVASQMDLSLILFIFHILFLSTHDSVPCAVHLIVPWSAMIYP